MSKIKKNIQIVLDEIKQEKNKIRLVAVSKGQDEKKIIEAFNAGQNIFGENYVQEAINKKESLQNLNIEWHFIGPIQSNKCRLIAENFSWVETVDRIKIANTLNQFYINKIPLNVCIQINVSEEDTKSGVKNDEVNNLAKHITSLDKLKLRGVMAIPSNTNDNKTLINEYKKLKIIYENLKNQYETIDTLSMGMSNDYLLAIENGSNLVRIGTKIFGSRK
jgi:hypothetical protein